MDKFTFFKNLDRILKLLLKAKEKNYTQNFSELTIGIESSDVPLEMLFERLVEDNNVKKIDMNKTEPNMDLLHEYFGQKYKLTDKGFIFIIGEGYEHIYIQRTKDK